MITFLIAAFGYFVYINVYASYSNYLWIIYQVITSKINKPYDTPMKKLGKIIHARKYPPRQHVLPSSFHWKLRSFPSLGCVEGWGGGVTSDLPPGPPLAPKNRCLSPGVVQWRLVGEASRPQQPHIDTDLLLEHIIYSTLIWNSEFLLITPFTFYYLWKLSPFNKAPNRQHTAYIFSDMFKQSISALPIIDVLRVLHANLER